VVLVDAYNVLGAAGVLPTHWAGLDLPGLGALIAHSRYRRRRVLLVCDGLPSTRTLARSGQARGWVSAPGLVEVRYAGGGQSADDAIAALLAQSSAARSMLVVSTDRRVRQGAHRHGAHSLASDEFLAQLVADASRPAREPSRPAFARMLPLSESEVRSWLDEFGVPAEDRPRPVPPPAPALGSPPQGASAEGPARLPPGERIEPELRRLLEDWGGGVSPDDLSMDRWLRDGPPSSDFR